MEVNSYMEARRVAYAGFHNKAQNARISARLLWRSYKESPNWNPGQVRRIAYKEAFERESAIALELIIKANIARKTDNPPKFNHDIPNLWFDAGLPKLLPEDRKVLLFCKMTMNWSGRYLAPKTDEAWEKDTKAMAQSKMDHRYSLIYSGFEKVYQIAETHLNHGVAHLPMGDMTHNELHAFLDPEMLEDPMPY